MEIDRHKLKLNSFTAELEQPLDRSKRILLTTEVDCYDVSTPDKGDGTFDQVFRCKVVGTTIVRQGGDKATQVCKSKRTQSQRLRAAIWALNSEESYYQAMTDKIIANIESVIEYLKDK